MQALVESKMTFTNSHWTLPLPWYLTISAGVNEIYSSSNDFVNGSDFIHRYFGGQVSKAIRRHNHFKGFFSLLDTSIPPPSRDSHPEFKFHPILNQMLKVSQESIFLGRDLSCDEQIIGFQVSHIDKKG